MAKPPSLFTKQTARHPYIKRRVVLTRYNQFSVRQLTFVDIADPALEFPVMRGRRHVVYELTLVRVVAEAVHVLKVFHCHTISLTTPQKVWKKRQERLDKRLRQKSNKPGNFHRQHSSTLARRKAELSWTIDLEKKSNQEGKPQPPS